MKRISIMLLVIAIVMIGCTGDGEIRPESIKNKYKVVTIDGVKYIVAAEWKSGGYQGYGFMAKKELSENEKKEIENIVRKVIREELKLKSGK